MSPEPYQEHYLNHGEPVADFRRRRLEELQSTLAASLYWQIVPTIGEAQPANQSPLEVTPAGVASLPNIVALPSTIPAGLGLPTPSSTHDAGFSPSLDPGVVHVAQPPPPSRQAAPQAQQAAPAHLSVGNGLQLSLGEDDVLLCESQDASSSWYPMQTPQDSVVTSESRARPGKRRRDEGDISFNEAACPSLFSPVETPSDFSGDCDGVCYSHSIDFSGSPSSPRRTKVVRTRKDKAAAASSEGPGPKTKGLYLGPAASISHWLSSAYRNSPGGPICNSPSSESDTSSRSKGKGRMKSPAAGADHPPRIPLQKLRFCVFCGVESDTMTRHLETHPQHGGGEDGWVTVMSKGKFPSGKRLIEAVLVMLFATAKKDYAVGWTSKQLTARQEFIKEYSAVDLSDEAVVKGVTIPQALEERLRDWAARLSDERSCHLCRRKFARPDSCRRHEKTCGSSSTAEASTPSTSWIPSSGLPWPASLSTPESTGSDQLLDLTPSSPKRRRC